MALCLNNLDTVLLEKFGRRMGRAHENIFEVFSNHIHGDNIVIVKSWCVQCELKQVSYYGTLLFYYSVRS